MAPPTADKATCATSNWPDGSHPQNFDPVPTSRSRIGKLPRFSK
jgi:hypothetical protein